MQLAMPFALQTASVLGGSELNYPYLSPTMPAANKSPSVLSSYSDLSALLPLRLQIPNNKEKPGERREIEG